MCFLVAFLRCFLNVENARILPFEVGKGAVLPGMQTSGVRRNLRITLRQIYKVESRLSAGVLRAGDSGRIIDSFAQPSMDDLYKSFCICSKDRKYFSGASGIKISDNEHPLSDLGDTEIRAVKHHPFHAVPQVIKRGEDDRKRPSFVMRQQSRNVMSCKQL